VAQAPLAVLAIPPARATAEVLPGPSLMIYRAPMDGTLAAD
jgi:hypothetical protein